MKQVIVLVGPKGAGKSTIGTLLSKELGIHFLRAEPLFLEAREHLGTSDASVERRGFESVLAAVSDALGRHDTVCFESTGVSRHLSWVLDQLRPKARVLPVRVVATVNQCLSRIYSRETAIHIPVSDDRIEAINALAAEVTFPWSAELDNRGDFDRDHIKTTIANLLRSEEMG